MHGRFLLAVTAGVAGLALLFGHPLMWRLTWALVCVLTAAAILTWSSTRWIELGRRTRASRAEVGGLAEESFSIHNRGWLPKLWLEVRDLGDMPGHHAGRVISTLWPGRSRSWTVRTVCRRRGMFRLGPVAVAGGDPLGIFRSERHFEQTAPFVVFPRSYALREIDLPTGFLSGGRVIRRRTELATSNVRGVRSYRPGDDFKRIHWPTSARRGQLFTREFELDPVADYWILLDLDRTVHAGELGLVPEPGAMPWLQQAETQIDPTSEEHAVTAAASLARHFLESGKSVGLIAHGQRRIVAQPDRGDRQLAKILTHLAVLRAAGRAGLSEVLSAESHEFKRHATLVVITPTTSLRWVEALRGLKQRGVHSLAVLIEANTFGPAGSSEALIAALAGAHVPTRIVRNGEPIAAALEGR